MIQPLWKIERLRQLLAQQEAEAMQSHYPQASPKVTVERAKVEEKPEPPTLQKPDNGERPARLRGLTVAEILMMQGDGDLTPQEETWLSYKTIPDGNGFPRMPNLRALARRAQRTSEKQ